MAYEIEKNVPLPAGVSRGSAVNDKYQWDRMEVGDSFFIGEEEVAEGKTLADLRQKVYNAARAFGKPKGREFKALVVEEEREIDVFLEEVGKEREFMGKGKEKFNGVRIWRLEDPVKAAEPA